MLDHEKGMEAGAMSAGAMSAGSAYGMPLEKVPKRRIHKYAK